jgi:hypothetical protein
MSNVIHVDRYASDGRLKLGCRSGGWSIYIAFVERPGGDGLIRIGASTEPLRRMYMLHREGAHAIGAGLWSHIGSQSQAVRAEKALKRRFADRQVEEGWFAFDLRSAQDKAEFHTACRVVCARATGELPQWRKTNLEQMRIAAELSSPSFRA